ncbi:glycosyltransferase [Ancylothrix sp. C2]|uniref:glycosyltransferase n=1 Tax=Ancylothrix sp. D3o TaxID=2953691 RepID=UPI0021BAFE89|nr:glycosyltransferase [Ancylothrix sp. D3o]MCT7948920.1 glycosyltransferase [Ancylothrix sp. D3o]
MKYALVHEWLTPLATGGSELVVKEILQHIDADLYALIDFESRNPESYLYKRKIGTTFLQKMPMAKKGVQKYLPLLPIAIEQIDLREYEIVLSSSHAVAKGVLTSPQQLHICYCHTPMRYAWEMTFDYLDNSKAGRGVPGILTRYLLHRLREWEVISANRVDYFIANSKHTARRIWRCYRREAAVIYPPVEQEKFKYTEDKEDYYITVCRLVSYKKVSLIVQAFNEMGKPLIVIGSGPELAQIRKMAKPNVKILGWQPESVVCESLEKAKAFVYAACEDFGIALVEAQACGTPVIAYRGGGAGETVRDIRQHPKEGTGWLFGEQTVASIIEAVESFETSRQKIAPEQVREQALKFTPKIFAERYLSFLERQEREFQSKNAG